MKSDQSLLVYWTRGIYFNSKLFDFIKTLSYFKFNVFGLALPTLHILLSRLEINNRTGLFNTSFSDLTPQQNFALNNELATLSSVSYSLNLLLRFTILKFYFIRSYRGICHLLGKPVRGQRTWSNAWNSFYLNKTVRHHNYQLQRIAALERNSGYKVKTKIKTLNYNTWL